MCYSGRGVRLSFPLQTRPAPVRARPGHTPVPAQNSLSAEQFAYEAAVNNPVRKMGFYFGLTFVFLRFSMIHETITKLTHINLYLPPLPGTVSIVLTLPSGPIPRTCQNL